MLFLLQNGYTDVGMMMFYQNTVVNLVKGAWAATFAPKRLAYDPDKDAFVYAYEVLEGAAA